MAKPYYFKVEPGSKVDLSDYPPRHDGGMEKAEGEERIKPFLTELDDLQDLMYGAGTHALLVVLQGMDTSGKDGLIKGVLGAVNPQGLQIASFKAPTAEEAAHDFLWRIHAAAPGKGFIGVYNRSHYEEVLVVRVEGYQPEEVILGRYDLINQYEHLLTATDTIVVKMYLHISREEQAERLIARQEEVRKSWKLNPADWSVRAKWDSYMEAYRDALAKCSTAAAPWYVIPSDRKWYRNLAAAQLLVEHLRPYRAQWEQKLADIQADRLPEVHEAQARVEGTPAGPPPGAAKPSRKQSKGKRSEE